MSNLYNILIADDEGLEREALKLFLRNSSLPVLAVYEAANGQQVLSICDERRIDIVILDIRMPVLSGLETLELLRAKGNNAKVIISTAYDMFQYAVKAMQYGASDFLVKPVEEEVFLDSLQRTIDRLDEEARKEDSLRQMQDYLKVPKRNLQLDQDSPDTVNKICNYIAENYGKRIGLDEIAEDCGYSKYYINKLFRAQMDTTIVDYLINFRMDKAKELLTFTNESVKIIAFRVGYSDPNYFNWTFRKKTGKSPLQFRAESRKPLR